MNYCQVQMLSEQFGSKFIIKRFNLFYFTIWARYSFFFLQILNFNVNWINFVENLMNLVENLIQLKIKWNLVELVTCLVLIKLVHCLVFDEFGRDSAVWCTFDIMMEKKWKDMHYKHVLFVVFYKVLLFMFCNDKRTGA